MQQEKTQNSILQAKRGLDELQDKLTSVSKMTQQEEGRHLAESIELSGPLDKRVEEVLRVKDELQASCHILPQKVYKSSNQMK